MDIGFLMFIQEHLRSPLLTPFFVFITSLGNAGGIWIVLTILFLLQKKYRLAAAAIAIALISDFVIVNIFLKNIVARPRPFDSFPQLLPLITRPADFSFPSGHSASSFAAATAMLLTLPRKFSIPALILAIFISFSRLYIGVHYPTDVLCGIFLGILCGYLSAKFINQRRPLC